jgi:OmpA-OmpF porin, OOP family
VRWLLVLAVSLVLVNCAGSTVRDKAAVTAGVIDKARANGAQRCAPVELAMAESHNDFAGHALDEGNYFEAKREAAIAETNAQAAFDKSPKEKCLDKAAVGDADGDGILDDVDKCPRIPEDLDGFEDQDGCPEDDNDKDGINDKIDACPLVPEDRDNFEDDDGCPDLDNDKDGIADKIDACPNDAEDKDSFEDDDGCPDLDNDKDGIPDLKDKCPLEPGVPPDGCPKKYTNVVVTQTKIEIKQTVFFATNKATIKPVSFGLLTEVAQAMKDNPTINVDVEGHTDSQGNDKFNLKLSQKRAESVKKFLVGKGVPSTRMRPKGYGENVPIADNRTADGRAQNRRVEFVITSR